LNTRPLFAFVALLATSACLATADGATRLPDTVRPTHYHVAIEPDAAALTFAGEARISVDVLQSTSRITLNALELGISSARLTGGPASVALPTTAIDIDTAAQTATFRFDRALPVGSYELLIDYTGRIGTQAEGLFAIDYDTATGSKRALYTQFEVAHARRFFPSWDEPDFKAVFTLQVTVPTAQMAVSNMPVARRTDLGNGRTRVEFQPSPKMSTYLLFLGVGDFDRQVARVGDTEVGVVTRTGLGSQAAFALESSQRVLAEYNNYFGAPYPLPKLDNVAAPK
jgi:aminopeptidase N